MKAEHGLRVERELRRIQRENRLMDALLVTRWRSVHLQEQLLREGLSLPSEVVVRRTCEAVAAAWGLTMEELLRPSRDQRVSHARQAAYAALRQITTPAGEPRFSLPAIGRQFGVDHSTVHHGVAAHLARQGEPQTNPPRLDQERPTR